MPEEEGRTQQPQPEADDAAMSREEDARTPEGPLPEHDALAEEIVGEAGAETMQTDEGEPMKLVEFTGTAGSAQPGGIDLLMDVDLEVKIELGRADMAIEDILQLRKGSVVELDKLAGDPVDILVNDRPVAKGEILVVNDNFCVRVTEIIDPEAGLVFEDASDE